MKKAFRDIKRGVNKKVLKVPSIEQKVLDATSNEPWGPHGTHLADIAQASRNYHEYQMIMAVVWKRLSDTGKNWRHVYKALTVLEYLVANGTERVIEDIREHAYQISTLSSFQYIDSTGRDQGSNIRKKSQSLVALVNDKERIQETREKAAASRDKLRTTGGDEGRYGSRDEDRNGYGYGDERYGGRYSEDQYSGYKDDEYRGRSRSVDGDNGIRSRSSDRERSFEDEGHRSSRGSNAKGEDSSQDGSRLESKLSGQSFEAPPSYEDVVGDNKSNGENTSAFASNHQETEVPTPPPAAATPPPLAASTPTPVVTSTMENEEFDLFDPRASFPDAPPPPLPPVSGGAEMDLFGSLSDSFSSNTLALVTTTSATTETHPQTSTNPYETFLDAPASVSTQPFDDPFGDGPFKAIPSTDGFSGQQSTSPFTASIEPTSNVGFGGAFDPTVDILADILPPPGPPQTQPGQLSTQTVFPSQTGQPNQTTFPSSFSGPFGEPTSQPTFQSQGSQPVPQHGFQLQNGQPMPHHDFQSQSSQTKPQYGAQHQNGQPMPHHDFQSQNGQPMPHHDFQSQSGQTMPQYGGQPQSGQPMPQYGGQPQSGQPMPPPAFAVQGGGHQLSIPAQGGQSVMHPGFLAAQGGQSVEQQPGFPAQGGQSAVQKPGFPAHGGQSVVQQPAFPAQGGQSAGFPAQGGQSAGLPAQGGQSVSQQPGFAAHGGQSMLQQPGFPVAQGGQSVVPQPGFAAQGGQSVSQQPSFSANGGQSGMQPGFPAAQGGQSVSQQPGFLAQGGQSVSQQPSFSAHGGQSGLQPDFLVAHGSQSAVQQPGFSATQGGQSAVQQPGFAAQGGQLKLQQPGFAPQGSQNGGFSQAGFPSSNGQQSQQNKFYMGFQPQSSTIPVSPLTQVAPAPTPTPQYNASNFYQQQPSLTASTNTLPVVPQKPTNEKFETKSTVWADTLNRGLVNLNISGAKTNPLSDIGIDFEAINRKEKRMEKPSKTPVTSTVTMGKAMGSGTGMGRAGAGALRPAPNAMVQGPQMGAPGGYGPSYGGVNINQPMGMNNMPPNMGMGMNVNQGFQMLQQPPVGFPPGGASYNPMMGRGGGYAQQQYGYR